MSDSSVADKLFQLSVLQLKILYFRFEHESLKLPGDAVVYAAEKVYMNSRSAAKELESVWLLFGLADRKKYPKPWPHLRMQIAQEFLDRFKTLEDIEKFKREYQPENPPAPAASPESDQSETPLPAPSIFYKTDTSQKTPEDQSGQAEDINSEAPQDQPSEFEDKYAEVIDQKIEGKIPPPPPPDTTAESQTRPTQPPIDNARADRVGLIMAGMIVITLILCCIGVLLLPGQLNSVTTWINNRATQSVTTPPPSITVPPSGKVLFEDTFGDWKADDWTVLSGQPLIANNMLTVSQPTWLMVGEPTWKNYRVEFSAYGSTGAQVGLRATDLDHMVIAWMNEVWSFWIIQDGQPTEVPNSRVMRQYTRNPPERVAIIVEGNKYSLLFDGRLESSTVITTFETGKVAIFLNKNALIDDFKVTELP